MKILITAYYVNGEGGSGRFMRCLSYTLADMGHEVMVSSEPEEVLDREYDLIICSHFLHRIKGNPAPKICISHGIVDNEWIYPGAQKYVSISEEVKAHNLKYGILSEVIGQPIVIGEQKRPGEFLEKILVIRRHENDPCPFKFLGEIETVGRYYELRYSDPEIPIEDQIEWADLCITLGRGALESMAQGKPVLVADNRDYMGAIGDGYITQENINEIAKHNFSGRRYNIPLTRDWIEGELNKYNQDDSDFLYGYVTKNHEAKQIARGYLKMVGPGQEKKEAQKGLLSIVIPIWNQHTMTNDCIQAIMENTEAGTYEIICIDNGSDPPYKPPFSGFNETRIIRNKDNKGFPIAANQGIRDAKGDVICLFNNDIFVTPGWAERLLAWLDEFDIVAPMTNYSAGVQQTVISSYQTTEELAEAAEQFSEENEGRAHNVNFATISMFIKREIFDDIGYLDETLWPSSGEDIDFGFRAREAGYKMGIANDVYVHHEGSQTFKALEESGLITYGEVIAQNDKYLAEKWGEDFWHNQMYYGKTTVPGEDAVRLNLGCGGYPKKGFVNVDQLESVKPDLLSDVTDLPYRPNTADEIYCGHLLEHLSWDEGQGALKHWLDILKPGGEIRIVVPDFDILAKRYFDNPTPGDLKHLNDFYIYSYVQESPHRYFYSAGLLKMAMGTAGFKKVEQLAVDDPYFVEPVPWQCGFVGVKG